MTPLPPPPKKKKNNKKNACFKYTCSLLVTGPAVVISFLIGGFVTLLNALCFTEYAAKTPKTGAQYTYMYETIGEAVAFLVGWTLAIGNIWCGSWDFGIFRTREQRSLR